MPQAPLVFWAAVVTGSAGLSAGLILVLKPLLIRYALAHLNDRSSHATATPQGAGLAVMAALLIVTIAAALLGVTAPPPSLIPVLAGAVLLTAIGAADDAHALPVTWRLMGEALIAAGIVLTLPLDFRLLPELLPLIVERALMVLGVIWFVNVINFLDGLDWMMVAQVVPITLGVAILQGLGVVPPNVGLLALALLGATLGFAAFNKHPAQIFLGDAGSLPIGLMLAYMLIYVAEAHLVSALLLALYGLADATVTLGRRALDGEQILSAHKTHFYQRAVSSGLSVPQVTARVFGLGIFLAVLAIGATLALSPLADILLLALGAAATGFVLFNFTRGR